MNLDVLTELLFWSLVIWFLKKANHAARNLVPKSYSRLPTTIGAAKAGVGIQTACNRSHSFSTRRRITNKGAIDYRGY